MIIIIQILPVCVCITGCQWVMTCKLQLEVQHFEVFNIINATQLSQFLHTQMHLQQKLHSIGKLLAFLDLLAR